MARNFWPIVVVLALGCSGADKDTALIDADGDGYATTGFDADCDDADPNVHPGAVDAPDAIAARVETALRHLAPERVVLNPDCGFAPGSAARVDMDEVYLKLKNQTEAAELLRRRHG